MKSHTNIKKAHDIVLVQNTDAVVVENVDTVVVARDAGYINSSRQ